MGGKTIKLYIMGDEYNNLKTAELSNWSGKAYIGERKHSKLIQGIDELSTPGIYFLLTQDEDTNQKHIYIGEADDITARIANHYSAKAWWETFIAFISKDSNLTKAHVRYLEKRFYKIAKENGTAFNLENTSEPPGSKLPKSDVDDLEDFLQSMIYVLQNLSLIDFVRTSDSEPNLLKDGDEFYLPLTNNRKDEKGEVLKAFLKITKNGYRLLKGSFIEKDERSSFKKHNYYSLRKKIETQNMLKDSKYNGCYILVKDIDFTSSSAAASVAKNRATNGPKEWKLESGLTLDDWEMNHAANVIPNILDGVV